MNKYFLFAMTTLSLRSFALPDCDPDLATGHLHKNPLSYIAGMEKSSHQKLAYGAQARPGRILDLGSGSGISARDLALFLPDSKVVGVDVDYDMTTYARDHYKLPNLSFRTGDATKVLFRKNSIDTCFMSSTTHHLTSFGFGTFDVAHVIRAIAAVHEQLKFGGLFILRDFVLPEGPSEIFLHLPNNDGRAEGTPEELSTAAFFLRFVRDFRNSQHPKSGVSYIAGESVYPNHIKFKVSYRDAVEFVLRKDYRKSYESEIKEEYLFFKARDYENAFIRQGFRILQSAEIYNPWIIENRFQGHFVMTDLQGRVLPFPPTNYVIVGEKVKDNEGVAIRHLRSEVLTEPRFLQPIAMRDKESGAIFDVVDRPNETFDVLPYFEKDHRVFVLGKQGFPRPLATLAKSLVGVTNFGYVTEPITFIRDGSTSVFAMIENQLLKRAGIPATDILPRALGNLRPFYPSPGTVSEKVNTVAVQIASRRLSTSIPPENYTDLSTSGVVRPIEATQLLRSAQAGSSLDARMEIAVYELLLTLKRDVGPWIGDEIRVEDQPMKGFIASDASEVLKPVRRHRAFEVADKSLFGRFLQIKKGEFVENNSAGSAVANAEREYAVPRNFSDSTISTLPVFRKDGKIFVGLEKRQLPVVQIHEGTSDIITAPAWRLPQGADPQVFVIPKLFSEFGVTASRLRPLGGPYYSTPGVTPEVVYPMFIEVDKISRRNLKWVELKDLIAHREDVHDGHLLLLMFRLAHALGEIKANP